MVDQNTESTQPANEPFQEELPPIEPEKIVMAWEAPNRPFKKRDREYFTTIGIIVFLLCLILFFAGQFLPIAVVLSIAFLSYVLASVPPEIIPNAITTYGVRIEDKLFFWDEMGRFWFTKKFKHTLLHIEIGRFPGRITLVLGNIPEEEIKKYLVKYLINETPLPTFLDNAADWLQEKFPLDKPDEEQPAASEQNTTIPTQN